MQYCKQSDSWFLGLWSSTEATFFMVQSSDVVQIARQLNLFGFITLKLQMPLNSLSLTPLNQNV